MERNVTHASLFSGIGAPELAAHWMGWQNLFHCEINSFCKTVLNFWYPNSKAYEDIKTTDFTPWHGRIDVLTGGFPCQPFSSAGRRRGAADDRYLWPEMLRAIREVQPTFVIGENVAGILSMVQPGNETRVEGSADETGTGDEIYERRQQFVTETVCQDLEKEGYSVQPIVVPACAVGAPHRRDRVWFVARRIAPHPADSGHRAPSPHRAAESTGRTNHGEPTKRGTAPQRADGLPQVLWSDAHPECSRCTSWIHCWQERPDCDDSHGQVGQEDPEDHLQSEASCLRPTVAHTQSHGRIEVVDQVQSQQSDGHGTDRQGAQRNAANAQSQRAGGLRDESQAEGAQDCNELSGERCGVSDHGLPQKFWKDFPTVAPVCCGNDGIPFDLSGLTISFPKWRSEAIKALGNAMVPQVVMELFRVIEWELRHN